MEIYIFQTALVTNYFAVYRGLHEFRPLEGRQPAPFEKSAMTALTVDPRPGNQVLAGAASLEHFPTELNHSTWPRKPRHPQGGSHKSLRYGPAFL